MPSLRQLALVAGSFAIASTASAQSIRSTFSGIIRNEAGAPIAGAQAEVSGLSLFALTDSEGRFVLHNLPSGNHFLQVHAPGYRLTSISVQIPTDSLLTIVLQDAVVEQQEVVVTGNNITEKRRTPYAISTMRQADLRQNASNNIVDAITRIPGISQISTGPAISKPIIRGLGYNRTVVLTDGVRQEGQQWGDEHGLETDDYQVSKVEVLKGPASLAYGSDALAGVVQILTDQPAPQGTVQGKLLMNYQTNNASRSLHGQLGGNTRQGFSWSGWGTGKEAQDYRNPNDGRVYNSRFQDVAFGGSLGMAGEKAYSRLRFSQFGQHLGLVEGERDSATGHFLRVVNNNGQEEEETVSPDEKSSFTPGMPSQKIRHQKLIWDNQLFLKNGGKLGFILGAQQNNRREFEDVLTPDEPAMALRLRTATYDLRYMLPYKNDWQLTLGAGGMTQQNRNLGAEYLIPDYQLQDAGAYAIVQRRKEKWLVSGGARVDYRSIHSEPLANDSGEVRFQELNRNYTNLSGSLGASYIPTEELTLRANLATGYRAPNIAELSANGVHEGTLRYEYGNQELKAERSVQADLGATFSNEHILVDAAVFYNRIGRYTFLQKLQSVAGTDSIPEIENPDMRPAFQHTQRDAALMGGELFVDFHPHPWHWLHVQQTLSYVSGRFANAPDSMKWLPMMPPLRWTGELRADIRKVGTFLRNGYIKTGLEYNAQQSHIFSAYETETPTDGYWLWSAGIGASVAGRKGQTLFDCNIAFQNLTNTSWQSHLSRLKYAPVNNLTGRQGIWGMGRNVSFTLSVPFRFAEK